MVIFSAIAAIAGAVVGALGAGVGAVGGAIGAAAGGLGTLGTAAAALSIGASAYGAYGQYSAQKKMASAQRAAEALRKKQAQLELNNSAINSIRTAQAARATNLVRGTSQLGSGAPFGSGLANANSSVESALGYQLDTTGTAGSYGFGIFDANASYSSASTSNSIASGISSLGTSIAGSLPQIDRVGNYLSGGAFEDWDTATTVSHG